MELKPAPQPMIDAPLVLPAAIETQVYLNDAGSITIWQPFEQSHGILTLNPDQAVLVGAELLRLAKCRAEWWQPSTRRPAGVPVPLVALKAIRYERRDIQADEPFEAVNGRDAQILVNAELARVPQR